MPRDLFEVGSDLAVNGIIASRTELGLRAGDGKGCTEETMRLCSLSKLLLVRLANIDPSLHVACQAARPAQCLLVVCQCSGLVDAGPRSAFLLCISPTHNLFC